MVKFYLKTRQRTYIFFCLLAVLAYLNASLNGASLPIDPIIPTPTPTPTPYNGGGGGGGGDNPTPTPSSTPVIIPSSMTLTVSGKDIVSSSGSVIYLRGMNQPDFANDADGKWNGETKWTDANAKTQLDVMKSWGANTIRCIFAVNQWKYDTIDDYSALHNREAIKRLCGFAQEKGLYVILTAYTLKSSVTIGRDCYQDPMPYPPLQTTPDGSSIIGSKQDFVNFWGSVANEMKGYPNVLFELWNEPQFGESTTAFNDWCAVQQQCVTAIRNTGANNLIIVSTNDWERAYCDVGYNTAYKLNVPSFTGGNIVYGVHFYRNDHLKKYWTETNHALSPGTYADVDEGLTLMNYYSVANSVPVIVSEVGCNMVTDSANELVFFENTLNLFNAHGLSYTAWGWWAATSYKMLLTEAPSYTPNSAGDILIDALR